MPRQFKKRWEQHKGAILSVSHDFQPFATKHSTTLSSAAAQNVDSGMSVVNEATASSLWSAQLSSPTVGEFTYELKGVFADGQEQVLEFVLTVYDREAQRGRNYS